MKNKILVIAAHPDDEILGCAGTIGKLIKSGYEAFAVVLGEGITSRDEKRERKQKEPEIKALKKQTEKANNIIGVKKIYCFDFPDNRFDTVPLLDIVKTIEKLKNELKPNIIFTHYEHDINVDHRITYKAVLTATRPISGEVVKEIYAFEVPSSTEWKFPLSFLPNLFYDITDTIEIKLNALSEYNSELRQYPHPRSLEGVKLNAQYWGLKIGVNYAEAFQTVRIIK